MICEVAEVYGHVREIPVPCYSAVGVRMSTDPRHGRETYVTPEDVRAASDQFDGEGILEDIDTQWGLILEGGVLEYCGYGSD